MRRHLERIVAVIVLAGCGAGGPEPDLVIRGVSVVDVESGEVHPDVAVTVHGDRITEIGPFAASGEGGTTLVVDGQGGFVIPGLWDMHVHALNPGGLHVDMLKLFVANGVTGFRDTWGSFAVAERARSDGAAGSLPVPRFIMSGNLVDGPPPVWPTSIVAESVDRGRFLVDSLAEAGAAFIKVYSRLPPDVFDAIAQRANERGIPFAGHVPVQVTTRHAASLGQRTIEHLTGVAIGCSSVEAEIVNDWRELAGRQASGETSADLTGVFARIQQRVLETQDDTLCREQWDVFVANDTWHVPTLVTLRGVRHLNDPTFQEDPRLEFMPPAIREFWSPSTDQYAAATSEADTRAMVREREFVGMMHRSGVPLLAGSDTPNPYAFPGFGLHDELSLLVESGLSPLDAVRAATIRPADFLGTADSLGSVVVGKLADLVILEDNPLTEIDNVRQIRGVVLAGVYYDRQAFDSLLDEVRVSAGS